VDAQGEPGPPDERSGRIRQVARVVAAAVGLWFIADGLSGIWPGASVVARVLIVVAVVLGVALAVAGLLHLVRQGRRD
jgi:hypothetical protein